MSGEYTGTIMKQVKNMLNTMGVREFLRSPQKAREQLKRSPLFVLSRNKPLFVLLNPQWYKELLEEKEELEETVRFREALQRTKFDKLISLEEVERMIKG